MCRGNIVRFLLHVINFLIWVCSVLLIVFGAIGVGSPQTTLNMLDGMTGITFIQSLFNLSPLLEGTSIFMIVLGSVLFLYTIFSFIAVHKADHHDDGPCLIMKLYWLSLICGYLAEVALMIFSGVYPGTTVTYIQQSMYANLTGAGFAPVTISPTGAITPINESTYPVQNAWEMLQFETQCCGAISFSDYKTFVWSNNFTNIPNVPNPIISAPVPPSCCNWTSPAGSTSLIPTSTNQFTNITGCLSSPLVPYNYSYWTKPCSDVVLDTLYEFNYISIGISAALLVVQMVSTILAILLRRCDSNSGGYV